MKVPETVQASDHGLYAAINVLRTEIKQIAKHTNDHRQGKAPEVGANITLAYRHLEDASMRLGKALQALDGGVSVYDKETTVGA